MKYIYLLFTVFIFSACSKDDIGPMGLKHGQEIEVLIDHRYGAINDRPLLLARNEPSEYSLRGFNEREPGYTYRIKARVHIDSNDPPIQDGSYYWLDFIEVISKEKYEGDEHFLIALVHSPIPGGLTIGLTKHDGLYYISPNKLTLTPANETVAAQLEEIWQHREEIREAYISNGTRIDVKWKSIKATVTHDQNNFEKSYLVSHLEFTE